MTFARLPLAFSLGAAVLAPSVAPPAAFAGATSANTHAFGPDDIKRLVGVSFPAISPDGKSVAFIVSRANFGSDRRDRELDLVDIASGAIRTLSFERKGISSPQWSPDGTRLGFVANDDDHHSQLFVMPMNGGDPRRLTSAPEGIEQFAWRPDGDAIAFVAEDEAPKKHGPAANADLFELGNDDLFVDSAPQPSHIWVVPSAGGDPKRLTSGTWSLPVAYPPGPPSAPVSWSPDGKTLLYTRVPNAHDGDAYLSSLWSLDVATKESKKLTSHENFEGFGTYSPDGKSYSYLWNRDGDPNNEEAVHVVSEGADRDVARELDRNPFRTIWMPNSKSLLVGANDTERSSLWIQPLEGPAKKLDLGDVSVSTGYSLDADVGPSGAIAFTGSTPSRSSELYYMATPESAPKRLTDFNAPLSSVALATGQIVNWTSDGFAVNGVLWTPPGAKSGKVPLVLLVHGGPTAESGLYFNVLAQAIAARGYYVFEPNYRGSDGTGNAFQRAVFNDAGAGPGRDVMAGLAAVEAHFPIDRSRIAVTGWSYGGYMTSWLIGHYHVWKTAISGAAVNNLIDEFSLSDGNVSARFQFAGYPSPYHSDASLHDYWTQSPLAYARNIHTPTLILTDLRDSRVVPTQSFEMYHALQENGTHVEFRAWPIPGHNPSDPIRSLQRITVWTEWLDRYLR